MNPTSLDVTTVKPCTVFFYCSQHYEPLSICLAEGFQALGIPFYANVDHWKLSPSADEFLFRFNSDVTPDDCAIVILHKNWFNVNQDFPDGIFHSKRQYKLVYLDEMDGPRCSLPEESSKRFDFVFRTHCHTRTQYPGNFVPWAFGLSERMLKSTQEEVAFERRKKTLLANFRVDQRQLLIGNWLLRTEQGVLVAEQGTIIADYPLRPLFRDRIAPILESVLPLDNTIDNFDALPADSYHALLWQQTGYRHHPHYYQRLQKSTACAAFAGWLVPHSTSPRVEWWDSWRFWESLVAGCVTFHVDFDKYGVSLPVMPENWRHYIGIDLDNVEAAVDRIASEPGILQQISQAGRQWVIENYSPVPTAIRFLNQLGFQRQEEILPFPLQAINLIIFPDWMQPEEVLREDLREVITVIFRHPRHEHIALLVDTSEITPEAADLILLSTVMDLMLSEELELEAEPAISLVGDLSETQWGVLRSHLQARLILEFENPQAITHARLNNLPALLPEQLIEISM